ncbi:MAG: hypothetical protein HOH43_09990 [Candidatus Latescibacteria bacterium]|jgi:hypothetical protein|nr:hypothetical protein [Candidatus Latescibacterota bacterium]
MARNVLLGHLATYRDKNQDRQDRREDISWVLCHTDGEPILFGDVSDVKRLRESVGEEKFVEMFLAPPEHARMIRETEGGERVFETATAMLNKEQVRLKPGITIPPVHLYGTAEFEAAAIARGDRRLRPSDAWRRFKEKGLHLPR